MLASLFYLNIWKVMFQLNIELQLQYIFLLKLTASICYDFNVTLIQGQRSWLGICILREFQLQWLLAPVKRSMT